MSSKGLGRREPCVVCKEPVFLAQRLVVGNQLYHRTCFRCARCGTQLSLAGCYETETDGQFCCEVCPDEDTDSMQHEDTDSAITDEGTSLNEEHHIHTTKTTDSGHSIPTSKDSGQSMLMSGFLTSQIDSNKDDDDDVVPALPLNLPPVMNVHSEIVIVDESDRDSAVTDLSVSEGLNNVNSPLISENISYLDNNACVSASRSDSNKNNSVNIDERVNQPKTASENDTDGSDYKMSLVSERRKMFETADASHKRNSKNMDSERIRNSCSIEKETPTECTDDQKRSSTEKLSESPSDKENNVTSTNDETSQTHPTINETNENTPQLVTEQFENNSQITEEALVDEKSRNEPQVIEEKCENILESNEEKSEEEKVQTVEEEKCNTDLPDSNEIIKSETTNESNSDELIGESVTKNAITEFDAKETLNSYPISLNPFTDSEDEDQNEDSSEFKNSKDSNAETDSKVVSTPKIYLNPFGSSDDEDENESETKISPITKKKAEKPPRPPPPNIENLEKYNTSDSRRVIPAPEVNLNPFWSEGEESDEEIRETPPIPKQRVKEGQEPVPMPRLSLMSEPRSFHGSSTSLSSTVTRKKKAPAPKPPTAAQVFGNESPKEGSINDVSNSLMTSFLSTPNSSMTNISPQLSPHSRKRRPAPRPPPTASSTFIDDIKLRSLPNLQTDVTIGTPSTKLETSSRRLILADGILLEDSSSTDWDKSSKDELNTSQQSADGEEYKTKLTENKSLSGQWKRKKGLAPGIPLFQKFTPGPPIPPHIIRKELQLLETQQRGLEKQGVRLEEIIRERTEGKTSPDDNPIERDPVTDDLVLQLFELVNEKNELFRRQSELMYIRRQQRLEEEHTSLENQIRLLMASPDANKTDSDKEREEELIARLLEVVERRNELVASMERDRVRERDEDKSIRERMASHRAKKEMLRSSDRQSDSNTNTLDKKKTGKKKWLKKSKKDKENSQHIEESKDKKVKKWFT